MDFFEIDRVVEDLAKNYAAPCTTTWFKVTNNKKPSDEEYRAKVVEFMKQFENILLARFPEGEQATVIDHAPQPRRGLQSHEAPALAAE